MLKQRGRPPRDPEQTREKLLDAALLCLARTGPDGLTFSEVSRIAKMNRATPYQYFETREQLIKEAVQRVSDRLREAIFGVFGERAEPPMESTEILGLNERLIEFGMQNPELCRVWLFELLSSPNPAADPFWKTYKNYTEIFVKTHRAQENIDVEVMGMVNLTSAFLWPIWVNAHARSAKAREALGHRFVMETMRQSVYGSMRPEFFPDLVKLLAEAAEKPQARAKALRQAPLKRA